MSVPASAPRLLIFSATTGFRHECIPVSVTALHGLARQLGAATEVTEDAGAFTDANLARFDAVAWLHVTGTVLDDAQRAAYERFTGAGGGFLGLHATADAERAWPLFNDLVGARFRSHPPKLQEASLLVHDREHPSTESLPTPWRWREEWYAFEQQPAEVEVLASVDEATYEPGDSSMNGRHPVIWHRSYGPARAWYSALGHALEAYDDGIFRQHLAGGLRYILNRREPRP